MTDLAIPAPGRLAFLRSADLEITPTRDIADTDCDHCGEEPAQLRVYGDPEPSWVSPTPFVYAEVCVECGAVCASIAVSQRSATSGAIRVEVAADVWSARDDD